MAANGCHVPDLQCVVSDVELSEDDLSSIGTDRVVHLDCDNLGENGEACGGGEYFPIRSKNEKIEHPDPPPLGIELGPDDRLEVAGTVLHVSCGIAVVRRVAGSPIGGVLDMETILFLEDGQILGRIYDTLGPVRGPFYAVSIDPKQEGALKDLVREKEVYFTPRYANLVFEDIIKQQKRSSDASNEYDEEIDESQAEFSDDQEEMLSKTARRKRAKAGDNCDTPGVQDDVEPLAYSPPARTRTSGGFSPQVPYNPNNNSDSFVANILSIIGNIKSLHGA